MTGLLQQGLRALIEAIVLRRRDMRVLGAETAGQVPCVERDLREALVEDTDQPRVPAHPHLPAQILQRHGVVSPVNLDVAVAMHHPLRFAEIGETLGRQRQERGLFPFAEHLADLLPGRAVDARIGHRLFPVLQMAVLLRHARERVPLEGVLLHVIDAAFHLALMPGRVRLRRQEHRAVVRGERLHLGHQLGIEPIGVLHRRAQVVEHDRLRHAAKMGERVLQTTQKRFSGLPQRDFAVRLAAMTEHDAKHMRAVPLAVRTNDWCALAKVHLHLLTGSGFHTPKGRCGLWQ